jgi:hypothetical protein
MAENQNYPTAFDRCIPYSISAKFVRSFNGYMEESPFVDLHTLGFITNQYSQNI